MKPSTRLFWLLWSFLLGATIGCAQLGLSWWFPMLNLALAPVVLAVLWLADA